MVGRIVQHALLRVATASFLSLALRCVVAQPVLQPFAPTSDPLFAGFRPPLIAYLLANRPRDINTVCLLGERAGDGSSAAWVLWTEGERLVLWDGGDSSMTQSRRQLDLRRDVVADEAKLAGSTWRVTRSWLSSLRMRCAEHGTTIQLTRHQIVGARNDQDLSSRARHR